MKMLRILVCGLIFASASVYAADKQTSDDAAMQKTQQSQNANQRKSTFDWNACVEDYVEESKYSQAEAYKKCDSLQPK